MDQDRRRNLIIKCGASACIHKKTKGVDPRRRIYTSKAFLKFVTTRLHNYLSVEFTEDNTGERTVRYRQNRWGKKEKKRVTCFLLLLLLCPVNWNGYIRASKNKIKRGGRGGGGGE